MEAPVEECLCDFDWVQLAVLLRQFLPVLCVIEGACMQWRPSFSRDAWTSELALGRAPSPGKVLGSKGLQQDRAMLAELQACGQVHDAQNLYCDTVRIHETSLGWAAVML